jgi:serine/threonine-protein kinase
MRPDEHGPTGGATHRVFGGRYRLIEPIGRGGMSVVWGAHDEVLRRPVAVKLLAPEHGDEGMLRARRRRLRC